MNDCMCHHCKVTDCPNTEKTNSVFNVTKTFFLKENAIACAFEIQKKLGYKDVTVEEHAL